MVTRNGRENRTTKLRLIYIDKQLIVTLEIIITRQLNYYPFKKRKYRQLSTLKNINLSIVLSILKTPNLEEKENPGVLQNSISFDSSIFFS